MPPSSIIVWLWRDLRLTDNPALAYAARSGLAVVPVYLLATDELSDWAPGAASRWWLHHALAALQDELLARHSRLIVRGAADSLVELRQIAAATHATEVCWNRRYEPAVVKRDTRITQALRRDGLAVTCCNGSLVHEPSTVRTQDQRPYRVFTPFYKSWLKQPIAEPLPVPLHLPAPERWPTSTPLAELALLPRFDWAGGLRAAWRPGSAGARAALQRFTEGALGQYDVGRDHADQALTSQLSPYLAHGELSPRQVVHRARAAGGDAEAFVRQLAWRDFAYNLLYHFPQTPTAPLRPAYDNFPWQSDDRALGAWQRGETGYPLVDAGMRQLWHCGWMHNRARMIVASFLIKDLLIPWQDGARWFWDTLVDADLANNTFGWQWTAGCGADASPFFRVFNPVTQAQKCDPTGAYVRHWLPALANLPDRWLHQPFAAPPTVLADAGVVLGRHYPAPIIDHAAARRRVLDLYHRRVRGTEA